MRILIAPDSFKGTLTARQAADAMAKGVRVALPDADIELMPIADGGEGMVDVVLSARNGRRQPIGVTGPLGHPVVAEFALIDNDTTALVESAAAIGLTLIPEDQRNPLRTTSYGLGELLLAVCESGVQRVIVGIGGSSTNDCGLGMAQALGVKVAGVPAPIRGGELDLVTDIDQQGRTHRLADVELIAACDVDNPLFGPFGATRTYGPQKGATAESIEQLERGVRHVSTLVPNVDPNHPGMGAAGGLGFGLMAFCDAMLVPGANLVLDLLGLERRLKEVDLVLTGEGRMDGQSVRGKACIALAQRVSKVGIPVVAVVGSTGEGIERALEYGITDWIASSDPDGSLPTPAVARRALADAAMRAIVRTGN